MKKTVEAYILINTEPGRLWEVAEAALRIDGIKTAHAVTGQFDIVIYAEFTTFYRRYYNSMHTN